MKGFEQFSKYELIDPLSLTKSDGNYEFLRGGTGRDIYYRQERYRVELLKEVEHLNPRIVSEAVEGDMEDFAITGVSCTCAGRTTVEQGKVLPKVFVMIGEDTYYSGRARVSHVTHFEADSKGNGEGSLVGLHLLDDVIDIDRILRFRSAAEVANELKATNIILNRGDISGEYKKNVADFVFALIRYRSLMTRYEGQLEQCGPIDRPQLEAEMLESAWASLKPTLNRLQDRLDALTADHYYDRDFQQLYRSYTVPLITPHLAAEPASYRAWVKPLGYPGDYVLMCYLYDNLWQGNSLYSKLIHRYPMEHPNGAAVRYRKDLLREEIGRTVASGDQSKPCRILALAAGPAREAFEFVSTYEGNREIELSLIDQDNRALGYVNKQMAPLLIKKGNVKVRYLYVALKQLIEDPELFATVPTVDLLYSAGLFDYLSTGKAKLLMAKLYEKLRSGGRVIIGNYGAPANHAWLCTYVYDWPLRYRTDQEMHELAAGLGDGKAEIELTMESGQQQYFVTATRPS